MVPGSRAAGVTRKQMLFNLMVPLPARSRILSSRSMPLCLYAGVIVQRGAPQKNHTHLKQVAYAPPGAGSLLLLPRQNHCHAAGMISSLGHRQPKDAHLVAPDEQRRVCVPFVQDHIAWATASVPRNTANPLDSKTALSPANKLWSPNDGPWEMHMPDPLPICYFAQSRKHLSRQGTGSCALPTSRVTDLDGPPRPLINHNNFGNVSDLHLGPNEHLALNRDFRLCQAWQHAE